jgi:hypothetical protein
MKKILEKILLINILKNLKFLYSWYKRNFVSHAPNWVKHKIIEHYLIKNSIFIETGTNEAKTLLRLHKNFTFCYSIEPSVKYFNLSKKNLLSINDKVKLFNDTSENSLEKIIKKAIGKNVTFFLDGHYSGKDTFLGDKETPIIQELKLITKYIKSFKDLVVIIDDFRCFELDDYPSKKLLIDFAFNNGLFFTVEHDMFIVSSRIPFKRLTV